ncbi:MAG: hypothetical protein HKL95_10520 [Phycisphaerae bacterium]|nr:hypothetical protein [Phycisphaerae bacterium]
MTRIKKSMLVVAIASGLAGSFAAGTLVNSPASTVQAQIQHHLHPLERHGVIKRGAHLLYRAIKVLSHGKHDFGGHRIAAIKDARMALMQCHAALEFDRH